MLTRKTDSEGTWYPIAINQYETLLENVIYPSRKYRHAYALRKNIAYNLQYIEFLHACLNDLKLSSVIEKQIFKNLIIVGCGIIESLLHFLLIAKQHYKQTEWELRWIATSNPMKIGASFRRIESHVFDKLPSPRNDPMTFDSMLKCAEKKRILGSDHSVYMKLKRLRTLRNRIHLQVIGSAVDTDWNAVERTDVQMMMFVLRAVCTGPIFGPTEEQRTYFDYLIIE
jgi:hypothetical protein